MNNQSSANISIRPAKSEDRDRILQVQLDSIQTLNASDYTPEQIEALLDNIHKLHRNNFNLDNSFVAEKEGEIIGYVSLGFLKIEALFVDPHFARQGVGTRLIKAIENEAKVRSWKVLTVLSSLTAEPFYQACGYRLVEKTSIPIIFSEKSVIVSCLEMEKWLTPSQEWEDWLWSGYCGIGRGFRDFLTNAAKIINKERSHL
jgi:putative acetyltransferase